MPRVPLRRPRVPIATLVAIAALAAPLTAGAQNGTLTGHVVGEGGVPLQGATVSLLGTLSAGTVRADGSYRIVAPAGRYGVMARLVGYASHTDSVTIPAGATVSQDFTLARAATTLEAVTTLGTRGEDRTVLDAPVPIDVLPAQAIRSTGRTETAQ